MKNFSLSRSTIVTIGALMLMQVALVPAVQAATSDNYKIVARFPVTGAEGWDYLAVDSKRDHLFVSRSDHVQVLDTKSGKMVANIADTAGVHGVAIAQDLNLGFTSNGRSDTITVFELDSLKPIDILKTTGAGPDSILYYPRLQRVYSFNRRGQSVSIIDAVTRKVIDTLPISGHPEFAVSDSQGHIFFNVEDKNEIGVIDAQSSKIVKHWQMAGCDGPSGLAIDDKHHRLFSVCGNKKMMVVDSLSGKVVTTVAIGEGPDAAAFDPDSGLVFVSNGGGTLTVVHQDTADKYTVKANLVTQKGARTLALDPDTHLVYLVSGSFGKTPAPTAATPRPRPPLLPNTVNVLVAAPN
ncbi:40-residue YVTN family beta-propeller repeat-containing protein [Collimonas sp. OK607]|uniref:YncE family protein n=1 Tax=Collimonas sp. OK607 TaxID=1798194 RepID=UPI0008F17725|nr:YncE family protein [Collimonas sp. OK607]SFB24890.1 40-residue YVTN family beta-propeller repeat-containing protein [Collimonas sp. OK607]